MVVADAGAVEAKLKQAPRRDVNARAGDPLFDWKAAAQPGYGLLAGVT